MDVEYSSGTIVSFPFERHQVDALFCHLVTHREHVEQTPVILRLHGILGNLLDETEHLLPGFLAAAGYSSLTMNTLLANLGLFSGFAIFDGAIQQIDLGASMVVHWAAHRQHPLVKGLILEGTAYSLPDSRRKQWEKLESRPSYAEVYARAKTLLGADPYRAPDDEVFVAYRSGGPSFGPLHSEIYTYKTWWFMIGPEAHNVMTYRHINKVNVPMLMLRGEHDALVEKWEAEALAQLVQEAGQTSVRVRQIPGTGHDCMANAEAMLSEIVQMMSAESAHSDGGR